MLYNISNLFKRLPGDILRLIFEYDDTYRCKLSNNLFKNQLEYKHLVFNHNADLIRNVVYKRLEYLIKTHKYWNPKNGIFYIQNKKMIRSPSYTYWGDEHKIKNIRNEVYIFLKPYNDCVLWKLIPALPNKFGHYLVSCKQNVNTLNKKTATEIHFDGFIGNKYTFPVLIEPNLDLLAI